MSDSVSASSGGTASKSVYFFGALEDVLFGYDIGIVGVALLFIGGDFALSPLLEGMIVSSLLVGAMLGVATCGFLADRLGRRAVILLTAVVFAVSAVGAALSPNVGTLIFFRFVMGLGVGSASVVVTVYLAEMAPTELRGTLTSLNQLAVVVGILLAYVVGYALAPFEAWRWMFGLALVPSLVILAGMYFMPETPRWLVKQGRREEALAVLRRLRGDPARAEAELGEVERAEEEEVEEGGMRELLAPWVRPALVAAVGVAVITQFMGINTIIYYAPTTLTEVGFGESAAVVANVGIGVVNVVMTLVAIFLIDRVGRKPLLLAGAAGMAASMTLLGLVTSLASLPDGLVNAGTLAGLIFFVISFAVSWGAVVRVLVSELFPLKIRGSATGLVLVLNWGANFLIGLFFPVLREAVGLGLLFFAFAAICVAALLFVRFRVTETKGRSLEEIQNDLRRRGATLGA